MCMAQDFVCCIKVHFLLAFHKLLIFLCPSEKMQSVEECMEKHEKPLLSDWICASYSLSSSPWMVFILCVFLYKKYYTDFFFFFFSSFLWYGGFFICGVMDSLPPPSMVIFLYVRSCNKWVFTGYPHYWLCCVNIILLAILELCKDLARHRLLMWHSFKNNVVQ